MFDRDGFLPFLLQITWWVAVPLLFSRYYSRKLWAASEKFITIEEFRAKTVDVFGIKHIKKQKPFIDRLSVEQNNWLRDCQ